MPNLPDYLGPNLSIIFVGYNPGDRSFALGQHFAGRNNLFWRLLHESGLTPRLWAAAEGADLPSLGLGLTNIVVRPSPSSSDLDWGELVSGAAELRRKIVACRPQLVCLLGKDIFRAYAGLKRSASVEWGRQVGETVPGVPEFVAPNPSGRSTIPYQEKLAVYQTLAREIDKMDRNTKRPSPR